MSGGLVPVVAASERPGAAPERLVLYHDRREDFSVYQPAGFVLRSYAFIIDFVLSFPLGLLVNLPFHRYLERLEAYGHAGQHRLITALLAGVPLLVYFFLPTWLFGRTLGKKIVGLRVIRASCNPRLGCVSVFLREVIGKPLSLSFSLFGFVMVGFTPRKRALHDYLAATVVVSYRER